MIIGLKLLQISCFRHNLDLVVKKGLVDSRIQHALSRCRSLVNVFHQSFGKSHMSLEKNSNNFDIPQHKLKNDVGTCWGSTYKMVSRVIEQQQAISAVLAEDRKYWHNMPTNDELNVLETAAAVLKSVCIYLCIVWGERSCCLSIKMYSCACKS